MRNAKREFATATAGHDTGNQIPNLGAYHNSYCEKEINCNQWQELTDQLPDENVEARIKHSWASLELNELDATQDDKL